MITKFKLFEYEINYVEAYYATTIREAIDIINKGHLINYSKYPFSTNYEIIEYAIGDDVRDMSEEDIEEWLNYTINWEDKSKGVDLLEDLENAYGYSSDNVVIEVKLTGEYAELGDSYIFAKEPSECLFSKVYYNYEEMTADEFLLKISASKYNI